MPRATGRHRDYVLVLEALAEGRRMTTVDVQQLTGRDGLAASWLLGNLKMRGEARVAGRLGRRAVYVLADDTQPTAPSWASRKPKAASPASVAPAKTATPQREALAILLRACRIGPPPVDPPYAPVISPLDKFEPAVGGDLGCVEGRP